MHRTLRLAAGAVVILVAGTGLAQAPGTGTDLFPLKKGSKWVYKVADQEVTVVASGTEKFDKHDGTKLDTLVGGQTKATELVYVAADGVYRAKVSEDKVDPPVKFLALPAKKGDSWKVDSKVKGQTIKGEFKITDDKAKVKVPAGEFDAVLVEGTDLDIAGSKSTIKQWFAPGKGIVKTVYVIQGNESTAELKEYTEGK